MSIASKSGCRFVDLFSGIDGFHAAQPAMGGECVYAVEIDPAGAIRYRRNWEFDPLGDVTRGARKEVARMPPHHVLVANFRTRTA